MMMITVMMTAGTVTDAVRVPTSVASVTVLMIGCVGAAVATSQHSNEVMITSL